MAQLSRPYQIALGAVAVLGLVWVMALRGHASNPSEPAPAAPSAPASTPNAASEAKAAAAPTPVYHGAAPGVEGLTRAIAKAHGAVATSQQNAKQLQRRSSEASGEAQASTSAPGGAVAAKGASGSAAATHGAKGVAGTRHTTGAAAHGKTTTGMHGPAAPSSKSHSGRPAAQVAVERELAQGKTAMLVFWNPKSSVDRNVQAQAKALADGSKGTVTLHVARANQVGMFGSITEVAHINETPTILIVNRHGLVSTLTGLADVFVLQQAVREARQAGR